MAKKLTDFGSIPWLNDDDVLKVEKLRMLKSDVSRQNAALMIAVLNACGEWYVELFSAKKSLRRISTKQAKLIKKIENWLADTQDTAPIQARLKSLYKRAESK